MPSPRALITGGAGFIGSHVADAFLSDGYEVVIVDDLSSGHRENVPAAAEFHLLDVRSAEMGPLVANGRFDVLCHLAAQAEVRASVANPAADASKNILGSLNLLEAVRHAAHRPRFVFSSTGGAVYGDLLQPPSVEDQPKDPESPYGVAKLSIEFYLAYYARVQGVDAITLRYANVYGPRQDPNGEAFVVAIFCDRLLDNRPLTVNGTGKQTRDYVFVGDVARANVLAARASLARGRRVDDRAFNIGTGVPTSVNELAEALQRAAGIRVPIEFAPSLAGEQQDSFVSIDKARQQLGWAPEVSLERGLTDTFAWFRDRRVSRPSS